MAQINGGIIYVFYDGNNGRQEGPVSYTHLLNLYIYYFYYNTTSLITLSKYSKFLLNMAKVIDIVSKTTYTILCNHIY